MEVYVPVSIRLLTVMCVVIYPTTTVVLCLQSWQIPLDMEDCILSAPVCYLSEITRADHYRFSPSPHTASHSSYSVYFSTHCNYVCPGYSERDLKRAGMSLQSNRSRRRRGKVDQMHFSQMPIAKASLRQPAEMQNVSYSDSYVVEKLLSKFDSINGMSIATLILVLLLIVVIVLYCTGVPLYLFQLFTKPGDTLHGDDADSEDADCNIQSDVSSDEETQSLASEELGINNNSQPLDDGISMSEVPPTQESLVETTA